ncbi:hypothetical protein T484DRAFT_1824169 [Baffinella frigidus]|nr:hypothetical protein T484DRAFT_1824169 [Cryptophyta sp. CCMP2293]
MDLLYPGSSGGGMSKVELARRKKKEREHTTALWARLELLAPKREENRGQPGFRSKCLKTGRSKEVLLKDVVGAVRMLVSSRGAPVQEQERAQVQHRDAFAFENTASLIVLHLCDSSVVHATKEFQTAANWLCPEGLDGYFFRPLLHPEDAGRFQELSNEVSASEEKRGEGKAKWAGTQIKVRMLRRPASQGSVRTPQWLLVYTQPMTMTLVDVGTDAGGVVGVYVVDFGGPAAKIPVRSPCKSATRR